MSSEYLILNEEINEYKLIYELLDGNKFDTIISFIKDYTGENNFIYLKILNANSINKVDIKKVLILDIFLKSFQYIGIINEIYDEDDIDFFVKILYLLINHKYFFNKKLDIRNFILHKHQILRDRNILKNNINENTIFNYVNNNFRLMNHLFRILNLSSLDNLEGKKYISEDIIKGQGKLYKKIFETYKFKDTKDFSNSDCFIIKYIANKEGKEINEMIKAFSCYQYCKLYDLDKDLEIESLFKMKKIYKESISNYQDSEAEIVPIHTVEDIDKSFLENKIIVNNLDSYFDDKKDPIKTTDLDEINNDVVELLLNYNLSHYLYKIIEINKDNPKNKIIDFKKEIHSTKELLKFNEIFQCLLSAIEE